MSSTPLSICWIRRDLRLEDQSALSAALQSGNPVLLLFIFDDQILEKLPARDARVVFLHQTLSRIKTRLRSYGSDIWVEKGKPLDVWKKLLTQFKVEKVFVSRDYEPYALERDSQIKDFLQTQSVDFQDFKDQVIFEKSEITKSDGSPYSVFTPYSKAWKAALHNPSPDFHFAEKNTEKHFANLFKIENLPFPSLAELGFLPTTISFPPAEISQQILLGYDQTRDFPYLSQGTSRLGLHLRFGTISIRRLAKAAFETNEKFLNELIWREFYMMILYHHPHTQYRAFKKEYDHIAWENNETQFQAWCEGKTGYLLVDAGMRELNQTGYMHNRVRMVVASFLTKHLLLPWQWGERYFAEKLLDFELASNLGGWQWAAGCGCDAAPYFRIFNPLEQQKKFDPNLVYVRKFLPEWNTPSYPKPIVAHQFARERAIERYKAGLAR
jgi:deoxyribodipyrimidine photo-lyase